MNYQTFVRKASWYPLRHLNNDDDGPTYLGDSPFDAKLIDYHDGSKVYMTEFDSLHSKESFENEFRLMNDEEWKAYRMVFYNDPCTPQELEEAMLFLSR